MKNDARIYAANALRFALTNLSTTLPDAAERELCCKALAAPSPANLRALLEVSRGKRWHDLISDALVECGMTSAGELLRELSING